MDKLEQKLILEAIKNNDKCLNIEINYKIRNRYGAPSAPKGRSICNVLPFVSPLNGKYFPAYTQWSSMNEASLDVGFKNYRHMSSSVFNCKRKIVGEWKTILQNKDYVLVTRFAYVDQLENNKDEINQYIENNKDSALANQDICQNYFTSIKLFGNSHAIINVNAFTSPINNVFVPAGTVFQSIVEISAKLGFPSRAQACNAVYSRYHKLQWWTKDKKNKSNPVFVALFATAAQLNLTSNNKDTIIQACGDYWNKHKNKIYATQSQFKRSNKRRQIVVPEDINIEGVIIQKGTVFPSTVIAAKALQFKSHATIRDVIKLRNGCVYHGRILYYDELTNDQKQQLAIH